MSHTNTAHPVTREDLATLLRAKIEAQQAMSTAGRVARAAAEDPETSIEDRVALDLKNRAALKAYCAAEAAYDAALDGFTRQDAA